MSATPALPARFEDPLTQHERDELHLCRTRVTELLLADGAYFYVRAGIPPGGSKHGVTVTVPRGMRDEYVAKLDGSGVQQEFACGISVAEGPGLTCCVVA